jgi:hypothetical protein
MGDVADVVVKTADGKTVRLSVAVTSTVGDLKERTNSSVLYLRGSPDPLADGCAIGDIDLRGDSALVFSAVLPPGQVTFKVPDGREVRIRYGNRTTVGKALKGICKSLGIQPAERLRVRQNQELVPGDRYIADLNLAPDEFLRVEYPRVLRVAYHSPEGQTRIAKARYRGIVLAGLVRKRLDEEFGVSEVRTGLYREGELVPDDATLGDLELPSSATLEFQPVRDASTRPLTIRTPKKLVRARYKEGVTVARAKEVLARSFDLPPDAFVFEGATDDSLLRDLGDDEEVSIHIYQPVTVEAPGKRIVARYAETATVRSVKQKISDAIGIPLADLTFDLEYSDEDTLLYDLKLPPVVKLVAKPPIEAGAPQDELGGPADEDGATADDEDDGVLEPDGTPTSEQDAKNDAIEAEPDQDVVPEEEEVAEPEGTAEIKGDAEEEDQEGEPEDVKNAEGGAVKYDTLEEKEEEGAEAEAAADEGDAEADRRIGARAAESRRVVFKFPDGAYVKVRFQPRATVGKAKAAVAKDLNIPADDLILKYGPNQLADDELIADLNIPRNQFVAVLGQ